MPVKACSRCGKFHQLGYICAYGRTYKNDYVRELRRSNAWESKAKQIKQRSEFLCEVCRDLGVYTYDGLEVHHIVKIRDAPELLLDDDNLITLCGLHHAQAERGDLKADYLRNLVAIRENKI